MRRAFVRPIPLGTSTGRVAPRLVGVSLAVLVGGSALGAEAPPSFRNEILPLLARQGCSSASCHGAPKGKGGLQLSLWGLDAEADHRNLVEGDGGRRVDRSDPARSLLLAKPGRGLPHQGGLRLPSGGTGHRLLHDWIAAGAKDDPQAPRCTAIEVLPASPRTLRPTDPPLRLSVSATFEDGTRRDVSRLSVFSAVNEAVASVTADGIVMPWSRGPTAVNVRYLGQSATVFLTVVEEVPGFVWSAPPPTGFVDELVHAQLQELRILPEKPCSDEDFLRRVHLDVVGILPEPARTRAFLDDTAVDKRLRLIDELLARPEHAKFWAQRWGDLLQIRFQTMGPSSVEYVRRIESAWAENVPYDRFVAELVAATGPTAQEPRANFYRMGSDHHETMEAAAVVLLGARIGCARCHNHPQEKWTQADYHGLRHFFHRVTVDVKNGAAEVRLAAPAPVRFPDSDRIVPAWLPGAPDVRLDPDEDPRAHLARWLSAKDNPHVARVEVNRVWSFLLGRGIVEPYDDVRETNPPLNPPLLDALARDFRDHGFDRRRLLRTILSSATYQAGVRPERTTRTAPGTNAARADLSRTVRPLLVRHCTACHGPDQKDGGIDLVAAGTDFRRPADVAFWTRVLRQVSAGHMPPEGGEQPSAEDRRTIVAGIRDALAVGSPAATPETCFADFRVRRLRAEQILDAVSHVAGTADPKGRATHLPVPDREPIEFLQAFGQAPRSTTCSCERPTESNLGEGLALWNGKLLQEKLRHPGTRFRKALREKKSDPEIVEELFLAAFCRRPRAAETSAAVEFVSARENRELAYEDLCWALIATNEFLTQH